MSKKANPTLWRSGKQNLEYFAMRFLGQILRLIGIDAASAIMGSVWQAIGPHSRRQERVLANLQIAFPDMTPADLKTIARHQWNNLGRTFAESFMIDRFLTDPGRIGLNAGILDKLADSGSGFVMVSLHTGNWELVSVPIAGRFKLTALYQQLSNARADRYVRFMREKVYRGGLVPKSRETPKLVMQTVRDGRGVAMLADHREKKGVEISFFGQTTRANPFPVMVARRLGVPLIAGRAIRLKGPRFNVEGIEIEISRTDDISADVQSGTQAIQSQFERWIREYPGQWMWVHDRWRVGRPRRKQNRPALDKSGPNAN